MSLFIDVRQLEKFADELEIFNEKAYPFAVKSTLNSSAFKGREIWQGKIEDDFTLRNRFTRGSIRVEQVRTLDVRRQEAVLGSVAPYMEEAEFGGTKNKKGKVGVVIPTTSATGEGEDAEPRKKLPRGANKLEKIQLMRRRIKGKSKLQRNVIAIKQAIKEKKKFVYLDFDNHPGIYRIVGKRGNEKIKLLYDLSNERVSIPATPTLQPTIKQTEVFIPFYYRNALVFQLKRLGLFK